MHQHEPHRRGQFRGTDILDKDPHVAPASATEAQGDERPRPPLHREQRNNKREGVGEGDGRGVMEGEWVGRDCP